MHSLMESQSCSTQNSEKSTFFKVIVVLGVVFCFMSLQGAKLYKWVDADGNVNYQDTPPPQNSNYIEKNIRDPLVDIVTNDASELTQEGSDTPSVLVTLYSIEDCDTCDLVRSFLDNNAVPYIEKNVSNEYDVQQELLQVANSIRVPTLTVGERVIDGYSKSAMRGALRDAGFALNDASE